MDIQIWHNHLKENFAVKKGPKNKNFLHHGFSKEKPAFYFKLLSQFLEGKGKRFGQGFKGIKKMFVLRQCCKKSPLGGWRAMKQWLLFPSLFPLPSSTQFIVINSSKIKKLIYQKLIRAPKNKRFDSLTDHVGHFWTPGGHFGFGCVCGIRKG